MDAQSFAGHLNDCLTAGCSAWYSRAASERKKERSINKDLRNKNTRKVVTCYSLHHNVIGIKLREGCSFCMSIQQRHHHGTWSVLQKLQHILVCILSDMCRWGMKVRDGIPEDPTQPYLIKKPTKWMTNCRQLADLLSLRCEGNHSHVRLEGGNLTKKAASYPLPLVRDILKVVCKVKQTFGTANYPKDPMHMTIPESLMESEHAIQVVYNQSTMTA